MKSRRHPCNQIDPRRALELRGKGLQWRLVGIIMDKEQLREVPFLITSVLAAVSAYVKLHRSG